MTFVNFKFKRLFWLSTRVRKSPINPESAYYNRYSLATLSISTKRTTYHNKKQSSLNRNSEQQGNKEDII